MATNQVSPGSVFVCVCVSECVYNYTSNAGSLMKKIGVPKETKCTSKIAVVNILVGPGSQKMGVCVTNSFVTESFPSSLKKSNIYETPTSRHVSISSHMTLEPPLRVW